MIRKAIPFHISIGPCTSGTTYPVRATFEGAETHTELLLPDLVLDAAADLLEPGGSAQLGDAAMFGRALGRALLTPPLRDLLLQSVKSAAQAGGRLQLQLQVAPAELVPLPWELVTIGVSRPWSPALRADYALARVGRGVRPARPAAIAGPLQILAVAAPGEAQQLDALEIALADQVRAGRIDLRLMRDATPATMEHALMTSPTHILHIASAVELTPPTAQAGSAGTLRRGTPQLMLRRVIDAFGLTELLARVDGLRLVTLTGAQGNAGAVQVGLPVLAGLLAAEVPATIAFGGPLPARMSAGFAAACYGRLAAGDPVDLAATAGRRALADLGGRQHSDLVRGWWGLAQLRLAPGGEQLFSLHRRPRPTAAGLRRPLMLAGIVAVLLAVFFGARAFGTSTIAHTQALASATGATPALPTAALATPAPESGGLLKALFGAPATATPSPTPTEPPTPTATPAPSSYATFLTGPNDSLESIAQRMGSDAEAIAALNHLDMKVPLRAERALVIPVYRPGAAGAGGLIINRGNPAEPKVALTFDIEIDQATLYGILDILRARGLHGTFFVTGHWVMAFPDAARAIVNDGHEICNHSLTHPYFSRIGLNGAAAELDETEKLIQQNTGVTSRPYFRFPYGDSTPNIAAVVAQAGYVAYHWSADDPAIPAWLDRVAQNPADGYGGILLMHGRPETVASLPGYLDRLAAMGLQATTLTDTLR
jgi:peptidoglycan/xylan/chitin deacetylase (PgdA/CDA1 family)